MIFSFITKFNVAPSQHKTKLENYYERSITYILLII